MPNPAYCQAMARYNLWQNDNLITAANTLSKAERQKDHGAFFGSIQQTFSHLAWGDTIWFSRFADIQPPDLAIADSAQYLPDWEAYCTRRKDLDQQILAWAKEVPEAWFNGDLSWYSGAIERDVTKPKALLVMQFFNHQTHHRGQIHAMLTAAGARPGDTDIPFMPDSYAAL
ncbi:DinB family protein [Falsiruegeria litorea R37]|uniref:DinB family protein n=1 Tax=Falsiruegeria litorea R37 TaxID=1200284 RepID=A0A1Y5RYE3_9RHOB|nr:DinB family protein [Falsiruegeria litorea]SLN27830.1 DinB family protein [Falsiruegeria litorea R37]